MSCCRGFTGPVGCPSRPDRRHITTQRSLLTKPRDATLYLFAAIRRAAQLWGVADPEFCKDLSLCPRGHAVFPEDEWWNVYCFAEAQHADKFIAQFGGAKPPFRDALAGSATR